MKSNEIKQLLDLCFFAKKITETLPALPEGMKPRYNSVLHTIYELGTCHASDVSRQLNTTMPSITKMINELESFGLLIKMPDPNDKRALLLEVSEDGKAYIQKYILDFHSEWAQNMKDVSSKEIVRMFEIMEEFKAAMPHMEQEGVWK